MKIVLLYLGKYGGNPPYAYEISKALCAYAEVFAFLSLYIENKKTWDKEAEVNNRLRVTYIKTFRSKLEFIISSCNIFRYISIIKKINSLKPDILYCTMCHVWDFLIFPFIKCKVKIKTIHDVILHKGENDIASRILARWQFCQADKYIILSKVFKNELVRKGIHQNNIIVVPHACFSSYGHAEKPDSDVAVGAQNRMLFFGRIIEYKGLHILLHAMKLLKTKIPSLVLVIAGNGDITPYKKEIDALGNRVELHNRWIPIEETKKYFEAVDIVIAPYTGASQSGVIPLAYAFAKPVIATNSGGLPEQVDADETGLIVPPNNSEALVEAIMRLLGSPEMLRRMSKNCYRKYLTELTWDASAQKILDGLPAIGELQEKL